MRYGVGITLLSTFFKEEFKYLWPSNAKKSLHKGTEKFPLTNWNGHTRKYDQCHVNAYNITLYNFYITGNFEQKCIDHNVTLIVVVRKQELYFTYTYEYIKIVFWTKFDLKLRP